MAVDNNSLHASRASVFLKMLYQFNVAAIARPRELNRSVATFMGFTCITKSLCFLIALLVLCGCRASTSRYAQPTTMEIPVSSVAREIQARGYRAEESRVLVAAPWEVSKFRMRNKQIVEFKAEQPLPNENQRYYCRFSLAEETYDSGDDARRRLTHLHDSELEGLIDDYTRVLRDGFLVDRTVYILQTDAAIFLPEIRRLTKILAASRNASRAIAANEIRREALGADSP